MDPDDRRTRSSPGPAAPQAYSPAIHDSSAARVYRRASVTLFYRSRSLTPMERRVLDASRASIDGGAVLDVGVGTGRTLRFVAPLAARYEAIDYSAAMVRRCRRDFPAASVRLADMRDLRAFADATFDYVLATNNVLDAVGHEDRLRTLRELHRVLKDGALLAFSTHNRNGRDAGRGPALRRSRRPVRQVLELGAYLLGRRNHRRQRSFRIETPEYAVFDDPGHQFAILHYYVDRTTQAAQLARLGFELLEVIDERGERLPAGQDDAHSPSLMYLARKGPSPRRPGDATPGGA